MELDFRTMCGPVCRTFYKQQPAFEFADHLNAALSLKTRHEALRVGLANDWGAGDDDAPAGGLQITRVFAGEHRRGDDGGGCYRTFTAGALEVLWAQMMATEPDHRHWYEIVREGYPCHLYLDVEFKPQFNPDLCGEALTEAFVDLALRQMKEHFGVEVSHADVLEMDSSQSAKFSRHVVVAVPGWAFASSGDAGLFVKHLLGLPEGKRFLAVDDEHGKTVSIVDTSVYSRNRQFRCVWSSKGPRPNTTDPGPVLVPTGRFALRGRACSWEAPPRLATPEGYIDKTRPSTIIPVTHRIPRNMTEFDVFLSSLVTRVARGTCFFDLPECIKGPAPSPAGRRPTGKRSRSSRGHGGDGQGSDAAVPDITREEFREQEARLLTPEMRRRVEQFAIEYSKAASNRQNVSFYKIQFFSPCIVLDLRGDGAHYCHHIGRNHKRNFVFYSLDLDEGVCYQKCWDELCRDHKGWCPRDIPDDILAMYQNWKQDEGVRSPC
ncbi:unnamed protein product [Pedinophyceae sp. YPF-701]|nr:unnamed protein product [Pedinophyceae sp. YPF-701]